MNKSIDTRTILIKNRTVTKLNAMLTYELSESKICDNGTLRNSYSITVSLHYFADSRTESLTAHDISSIYKEAKYIYTAVSKIRLRLPLYMML